MASDRRTVPLVSNGETETVRTRRVDGIGGPVADVSRSPRVSARDALETARDEGFDVLQSMPVRELLDVLGDASLRFEGIGLPAGTDDARAYERRVARATGLPVGWVRVSMHWLAYGMRHAAETLRAQSPTGGLDIYDDPAYTRERNVGLAFTPRVRVLGAVMPGNDPAVYAWPVIALAMKVPVVLRPSDRDPFTAVRLARALLDAGLPPTAIHVLPSERDVGDTVCREADHAMIFGDEATLEPYRDDRAVETYGPGNSVAVVARHPTERELDTLARGIVRAGGRTCFNLTRIVATGGCDPDALAEALARRVDRARLGPINDLATDVPAFPDPDLAQQVVDRVSALGDVMAPCLDGPQLVERDGATVLRPTVLRAPELVPELPFPFAGVTRLDANVILDRINRAYLGVCIGDDGIERRLVHSPRVRKVYSGRYPAAIDLRETHEEYLASFLYETTTYDP